MHQVVQIVVVVASVFAGAYFLGSTLKRILVPRSIALEVPEGRERGAVIKAEAVVRRGVRTVVWPVFGMSFVAALVAERAARPWMSVLILGGAATVSLAWHMIAIRRWWRRAVREGADLPVVEDLAEEWRLIWPHHTWMGRHQRRTWLRPPTETDVE